MTKTYKVTQCFPFSVLSVSQWWDMYDTFVDIDHLVGIKHRTLEAHVAEENDVRGEDDPQ